MSTLSKIDLQGNGLDFSPMRKSDQLSKRKAQTENSSLRIGKNSYENSPLLDKLLRIHKRKQQAKTANSKRNDKKKMLKKKC